MSAPSLAPIRRTSRAALRVGLLRIIRFYRIGVRDAEPPEAVHNAASILYEHMKRRARRTSGPPGVSLCPSIRAGVFACPALWRALVRLPCARLLKCDGLLGNAKVASVLAERHALCVEKLGVTAERMLDDLAFDPELCSSYSFLSFPFEMRVSSKLKIMRQGQNAHS